MKRSRVVILNGVSSVGKSSVAKAIQAIASSPFLYVAGDAFMKMLPDAMMHHPDGVTIGQTPDGDLSIELGATVSKLLSGMRRSIAAMASQGNDMIVDDIMLSPADQADYRAVLNACEVSFVGLFAPMEVVQRREAARKDRMIGLARWQYGRVHDGIFYDLKVDTASASPPECARQIVEVLSL